VYPSTPKAAATIVWAAFSAAAWESGRGDVVKRDLAIMGIKTLYYSFMGDPQPYRLY